MTDADFGPIADDRLRLAKPRKCVRHEWGTWSRRPDGGGAGDFRCFRCGKRKDDAASKRGRNTRKRGGTWEREAAADIGGRRMGQLNLPWDVEVAGYLRLQTKQLASWPSLSKVIEMLDAMGAGTEMRGVALKDAPGPGGKARRIVILDWDAYCHWHGSAAVWRLLEAQPGFTEAMEQGEADIAGRKR